MAPPRASPLPASFARVATVSLAASWNISCARAASLQGDSVGLSRGGVNVPEPLPGRNPTGEKCINGWMLPGRCKEHFTYMGNAYMGCVAVDYWEAWCSYNEVYRGEWETCETCQKARQNITMTIEGLAAERSNPDPDGDGHKAHHEHSSGQHVLLLLFLVILLGCFTQFVLERKLTFLPYTCALFLEGLLVGAAYAACHKNGTLFLGTIFHHSVGMWMEMDPHLFMFIFLPPLIFSDAMGINVCLLHRVIWQVLSLAVLGVLFGTALTAVMAKYAFTEYNWNWPVSLLFGSILSATDPVAVVALFHSLGVAPRLTMLVEGESLFNDGTAVVLFELLRKWCDGTELTIQDIGVKLFWMTSVGPALGIIFAVIAVGCIGQTSAGIFHSDTLTQMILPVSFGYLIFFFGEAYLESSGILSIVGGGIMVAKVVWPRFVEPELVRTFNHAVEFGGNTLVFFFAGMLFGRLCVVQFHAITWIDVFYLFLLYISSMVIRALMVLVLWPIIINVGPRPQVEEGIVMVWSGLRGAVGMALAIVVDLDHDFSENSKKIFGKDICPQITFHVCGMAALTLLVNGTLTPLVLSKVGLSQKKAEQEAMLERVKEEVHINSKKQFDDTWEHLEEIFVGADKLKAASYVPGMTPGGHVHGHGHGNHDHGRPPTLAPTSTNPRSGSRKTVIMQARDIINQTHKSAEEHDKETVKRFQREALLRVVQCIYNSMCKKGMLPRTSYSTRKLLESVDLALLESDVALRDFGWLATVMEMDKYRDEEDFDSKLNPYKKAWFKLINSSRLRYAAYLDRICYALLAFIHAHTKSIAEVEKFFPLEAAVKKECDEQMKKAKEILSRMPLVMVADIRTKMLANTLLVRQQEDVAQLEEEGIVQPEDAHALHHDISHALDRLRREARVFMPGEVAMGTVRAVAKAKAIFKKALKDKNHGTELPSGQGTDASSSSQPSAQVEESAGNSSSQA